MTSYRMPAEWETHERTWMAWPPANLALGETDEEARQAYVAWSAVANAIVDFEPVTMVVDSRDLDAAKDFLDSRIELVLTDLDDAWMRDMGPTFVRADNGELHGIDWIFNGWGAQHWAKWDHDQDVAPYVLAQAGIPAVASPIVNEGGGIHVNGQGTVLLTETVQLDPGRNPELSKADIEAELARTLGVDHFVWLKRGLTRDYETFGTRGHVDILAAFSNATTILYHDQQNPEHPDYEVSREIREVLEQTDFTLIPIPAPQRISDDHGFVDQGYINHYICNGAVIMCTFDDPNDAVIAEMFKEIYPGRQIVGVDAREIFIRGGGIHCITQQQPA